MPISQPRRGSQSSPGVVLIKDDILRTNDHISTAMKKVSAKTNAPALRSGGRIALVASTTRKPLP